MTIEKYICKQPGSHNENCIVEVVYVNNVACFETYKYPIVLKSWTKFEIVKNKPHLRLKNFEHLMGYCYSKYGMSSKALK